MCGVRPEISVFKLSLFLTFKFTTWEVTLPFCFTLNSFTMNKPKRHFDEDSHWDEILGFVICVAIGAFFLVAMIIL